jgi:two pore calcium channel protein
VEILDQSSFGESARYYFIFTRLDLIWSLNYFALLFLNFFEVSTFLWYTPTLLEKFIENHNLKVITHFSCLLQQPLWCEKNPKPSCKDRDYYYLGELPYLTNAESIIYEASNYT